MTYLPRVQKLAIVVSGGGKFVVDNVNGAAGSVIDKALKAFNPAKQGTDFVEFNIDGRQVLIMVRHIVAIHPE